MTTSSPPTPVASPPATQILAWLDAPSDEVPVGAVLTEHELWIRLGCPPRGFRQALRELWLAGEIDHYGELVCRLPALKGKRRAPPDSWSFDDNGAVEQHPLFGKRS